MASTENSGLGHGTNGFPQQSAEEQVYSDKVDTNETSVDGRMPPVYVPSRKHESGGWGTENPIKSQAEGQKLLDTGYKDGKQIYNVTDNGVIVKFQPDNSPNNGFHAYQVTSPRDIPSSVLKKMKDDGKISKSEYNKLRKGKV